MLGRKPETLPILPVMIREELHVRVLFRGHIVRRLVVPCGEVFASSYSESANDFLECSKEKEKTATT